jgi:DNA-binding FadR family transcriptional regulator
MFKQRHAPLRRDPVPDHARVFAAIESGDAAKAQRAMSELIELARLDTPLAQRPGTGRRR